MKSISKKKIKLIRQRGAGDEVPPGMRNDFKKNIFITITLQIK